MSGQKQILSTKEFGKTLSKAFRITITNTMFIIPLRSSIDTVSCCECKHGIVCASFCSPLIDAVHIEPNNSSHREEIYGSTVVLEYKYHLH